MTQKNTSETNKKQGLPKKTRAEHNKEKLAHNLRLNLSRRKQQTQEEELLFTTDE